MQLVVSHAQRRKRGGRVKEATKCRRRRRLPSCAQTTCLARAGKLDEMERQLNLYTSDDCGTRLRLRRRRRAPPRRRLETRAHGGEKAEEKDGGRSRGSRLGFCEGPRAALCRRCGHAVLVDRQQHDTVNRPGPSQTRTATPRGSSHGVEYFYTEYRPSHSRNVLTC